MFGIKAKLHLRGKTKPFKSVHLKIKRNVLLAISGCRSPCCLRSGGGVLSWSWKLTCPEVVGWVLRPQTWEETKAVTPKLTYSVSLLWWQAFIDLSNHISPFQLWISNQKAITWVDSSVSVQLILMGSLPFSRLIESDLYWGKRKNEGRAQFRTRSLIQSLDTDWVFLIVRQSSSQCLTGKGVISSWL